jgi:hypothetical protein
MVTIKYRAKACSIGSFKYKNLKLKKKEEEEEGEGSRRLLNTGSGHVPG